MSEETKRKIGEANRINYRNGPHPNTILSVLKYRSEHPDFSPHRGKKHSKQMKERMRILKTGHVHSEETKKKMSEAKRGDKAYQWKGGISWARREKYKSWEYRAWRKSILERDNYTCQYCQEKGYLHAHHIKKWSDFPELIYVKDNGITLCKKCHFDLHKGLINLGDKN